MSAPILSIITVCFNSESTIRQAILSVGQSKTDLIEYIVVDGGSNDATLGIIQNHLDIIDILLVGHDEGIFDAMNKGLLAASGLFVAYLNSDDVYLPGATSAFLQLMANSSFVGDVIYGDWIGTRRNGRQYLAQANHHLKARYQLCHQAMAIRRSSFPSPHGFNCRYRLCADFDLLLRLQQQRARFVKIDQPLVCFSEAGASSKYLMRSAIESIYIRLTRSKPPWSIIFALRVIAFAFKEQFTRSVLCSSLRSKMLPRR
jgi:glycosyltransferase involved in cell wall biosynthesis